MFVLAASSCGVGGRAALRCRPRSRIALVFYCFLLVFFFFSSRRRHTRYIGDWSSDVCSSDLHVVDPVKNPTDVLGVEMARYLLDRAIDDEINVQFRTDLSDDSRESDSVEIGRASCRERV